MRKVDIFAKGELYGRNGHITSQTLQSWFICIESKVQKDGQQQYFYELLDFLRQWAVFVVF